MSTNPVLARPSISSLRLVSAKAAPKYPAITVPGATSYYWDPASLFADDGLYTITPFDSAGAGRWRAIQNNPLGVMNGLVYGVVGDGVTDDTAAINTLLTNATALGMKAYLPGNRTYQLMGNSITVPDYGYLLMEPNTILLRSISPPGGYHTTAQALIVMGNYSVVDGGVANNTTIDATSSSSITITSSSITFTTQAGLGWTPSSTFIRVYSRANNANAFEGTVTAYNNGTGVTVVAAPFPTGSGTFSDWNINLGNVFATSVAMGNVVEATLKNFRVIGAWYTGPLMFADNSASPGHVVSNCSFENCVSENVQNRAFYMYGTVSDCSMINCRAIGNGLTNYGFNLNPANATGSANSITQCVLTGCYAESCLFQGFEAGDQTSYVVFSGCIASGATNASSSGCGFLIQKANTGTPQYNQVIGCRSVGCDNGFQFTGAFYVSAVGSQAISCGTGFNIVPSGSQQSQTISVTGCGAFSCSSNGFTIAGNSVRCSLSGITSFNNTGFGVSIGSGASVTVVTGNSHNNTAGNLSDSGTGSVTAGLVVT